MRKPKGKPPNVTKMTNTKVETRNNLNKRGVFRKASQVGTKFK